MAGLSKQAPTSTAPTQSTGGPDKDGTSTGTDSTVAPAVNQARGNDAAQAQVNGKAEGDSGLANYESALGEFLGKELYQAVSGALTFEKFQGYGKQAVDGAIKGAVDALGGWDKIKAEPGAMDALVKMLEAALEPMAAEWMDSDNGKALQKNLAGWVGAHPRTIVATALLAAAGAVIANVDIPTLKQSFGIGENVKGEVEADLGKIRALALKKLRAKISYTSGPLLAAVEVNHAQGGDTTAEATAKLTGKDKEVSVNGLFDGQGLKVAGLHGLMTSGDKQFKLGTDFTRGSDTLTRLSIVDHEGNHTLTEDFQYDHNTGTLTLGKSVLTDFGGGLTGSQRFKTGTDGTAELGLGMTKEGKTGGASFDFSHTESAYSLTTEEKLKLGLHYKRDDLTALLDATFAHNSGTGNSGTASGKIEKKLSEHVTAGADFSASFGGTNSLEVGAFYGFRNKEEFSSFLVSYRAKTQISEQQFGLTVEQKFKDIYVRYQQSAVLGTDGNKMETQLHAAKFVNTDTAVVGGVDFTKNFSTGKSNLRPELGVQYKGVQVLFGYDTENKAGTIRLGIPF